MPFDKLRRTLDRTMSFDMAANITDIINSNQGYITGLLKSQLRQGRDGNNEPVTIFGRTEYQPETLENKSHMSGLAGETRWITNYMSGDFYQFLFVEAKGTAFEFFSDVEYYWEIVERSDSVIMELNQENLTKLREELIKPELGRRWQAWVTRG